MQTQTSNTLHNTIMEAGSKDRPPMLAPGDYVQWKYIIKRYIETKPNHELIHYCLTNPPYKLAWTEKEVPISEGSHVTRTEKYQETYKNVSQDIRDQLNAEAEAVQIILTGIDNDIYSTVDACLNACEMWKAIERLKQDESINVQDLETNLYWEFYWISVRRDDDNIYKFKEGDFKRLCLQDIEDILLLLVQRKLSNMTVEERVKSYQKKLNLTKPDTYRSNLKRRKAYTAYSNPKGFIYQNKDKKNRLMRIDELYKFSEGTLNDVCNALDDRLKGIRMQYLPQTIWRKGNKDRAAAMIQSIDKMLKTRRIMRCLERFVGGRLYEGDFWMLQRTI
nr:hypothetical protein [Tanacetum cinerariifolium]